MPSSRKRLLSVLFDSGASFEQENAYRRWPVSFWRLRRIASACRDKGTTWSQPVFILAAGTVQRSASQSTSLHSISLTMPGRGMVSASKRKARPTTSPNLALFHGALMSSKTRVTSRGSVTPGRGVEMLAIICPLLERPRGRLPVLRELLLGARVFAVLKQVFGLVAFTPRVRERERAILAVAVRADGVGLLAGVKTVAQPPKFGGSVAGPA